MVMAFLINEAELRFPSALRPITFCCPLWFLPARYVKQLVVKTAFEAVAVVGKRQFQQMFGRKYFEERDQFRVVAGIFVAQEFFNIA
jgi:hypothetical protein